MNNAKQFLNDLFVLKFSILGPLNLLITLFLYNYTNGRTIIIRLIFVALNAQ